MYSQLVVGLLPNKLGGDCMKTQSSFSNLIDLKWYYSALKMLDLKERFSIDVGKYCSVVDADEFFSTLRKPNGQSLPVQRAIALAVYGTDCSTDEVDTMVRENRVSDVCMAMLYCMHTDRDYYVLHWLLECAEYSLEECILALFAFPPSESFVTIPLMDRITEKLRGNMDFILSNPKLFWHLLCCNRELHVKSTFLSNFERAVCGVPDINARCFSVLWNNGFTMSDAAISVWWIRKNNNTFDRREKGNDAAKELVRKEVAQHYRKWKWYEVEVLKELKGELGYTIAVFPNYKEYYKLFGFRLPELAISFKANEWTDKRLALLSDSDKLELYESGLPADVSAKDLKFKFSEWSVKLHRFYWINKFKKSKDSRYSVENKSLLDLFNPAEIRAKIELMSTFTGDELKVALEQTKLYSVAEFIRIVDAGNLQDTLCDEDLNFYESIEFGSDFVDYSYDEFISGKFRYKPYKHVYANLSVAEMDDLGEDNVEKLEWLLQDMLPAAATKMLQQILKSEIEISLLYREVINGCELRDCLQESNFSISDKTKSVLKLVNSFGYHGIRVWSGLTMIDCFDALDLAHDLFTRIIASNSLSNERYWLSAGSVVREWVRTGNPVDEMYHRFPLSANVLGNSEWVKWWLTNLQKAPCDVVSLGTLSITYGKIDGVTACITDVGILTLDGELSDTGDVPVWSLAPAGTGTEMQVLFSGGPDVYRFADKDIACDCEEEVTVKRI